MAQNRAFPVVVSYSNFYACTRGGKPEEELETTPTAIGRANLRAELEWWLATLLLRDHTGILYSYLVDHLRHNVANHHSRTSTNYWLRNTKPN